MQEGQPDPLAMFAPNLFAGTTALVTGGGRGMGKATALGFARYGGNVVIASNEPDELEGSRPGDRSTGRRMSRGRRQHP